jgi:hypothetical protein
MVNAWLSGRDSFLDKSAEFKKATEVKLSYGITGNCPFPVFWHNYCTTFSAVRCVYIEVSVSLVKVAKGLRQDAENRLLPERLYNCPEKR